MAPQHTSADILLISVTDVETRAVLAVFQAQCGPAQPHYLGDRTYYDLGQVGGARVWLARSEIGAGGPGGALLTVAEAIDRLQPAALLMVGIAFGLQPGRQQIGDVLVTRQVTSYDPQRIGTDAAGGPAEVARGDRASAALRLLDRCRDGALDWPEPPRVHVGLLLSGEKLIDHAPLARRLAQLEPEALGGDMESAGLYAAAARRKVDWIVIKAISDWADGQKAQDQQERQQLAAHNAARFALHVLRRGGLGPGTPRGALAPAGAGPPADAAGPAHLRPAPLPASDTRLLGRERELQELTDLLRRPDVRAVAITGPGGVGKTSLARLVACQLQPAFRDGAAWVALETVQDPALLWPTVLQALQLSEAADTPAEQVVRAALQECGLLLVLDTFEHLLGASAAVERLLADAPGLKLLITSQIGPPLAARTQRRFALGPLAVPADPAEPDLARLAAYPAVALFADCAARIDRSFQLTPANAPDVVALCRLLNGLPLAIELVSSRINAYSPAELCRALERTELFSAAVPAEQPRHRSLQDLFDWSYRLLDPIEQRLIARLAIFPGGFSHDSARAVCQPADQGQELGPALAALVNKSLIQRTAGPQGSSRFSMLKLIRTCAAAHLDARERELLRERFSAYFTELVHSANRRLHTPEQPAWVARLDQEVDNLREVLRWELQRDGARMARLAVALEDFWSIRGDLTEGCLWLNEASRHLERHPPQLQAQICASLGMLLARQSDYARSRVLFAHSLGIWQRLGDLDEIAPVIENFGTIANQQADYEQAQQYYQRAQEIYQRAGNLRGMAGIILQQGAVALDSGDLARAERLLAQALEQQHRLADSEQTALALTNLGRTAMYLGDLARSRLLLEEGLALWERLMHRQGRAGALIYLAATARHEGRLEEAAELCVQSRALFEALGDPVGVAETLEEQAHLALARADAARAARLLGAAELLRQRAGVRRPAVDQPGHADLLERLRLALGETACEQALQAGRLLAMRPRAAWAGLL